jgi:Spy/CpxP family protein refolding chaperone
MMDTIKERVATMKKSLIFSLVAGLLLSGAVFAGGHKGPGSSMGSGMGSGMGAGMHGAEGMGMPAKLAEKLDLSEQQKQDFLTLMELYAPRFKEIAARGKAEREALITTAPDAATYAELAARVSQEAGLAAAEVVTLMAELQSNVYALLNSKQQAKYLALRDEQQQRMQDRRERWQNGEKPEHHGKGFGGHHGAGEQCPDHAEKHAAEELPAG